MISRRILVSGLALAAFMGLTAPSPAETSRVKASGSAGSYRWQPDVRTITKGDRIVWKNPTSATHTVTAYRGNWSKNSTVASGARTSFKFTRAGTYLYRCVQSGHSSLSNGECTGMCGKVRVTR